MDWFSINIHENDAKKRIDAICKKIFPQNSYGDFMQWIRRKIIKINQKPVKKNQILNHGDIINIAFPIIENLDPHISKMIYASLKSQELHTIPAVVSDLSVAPNISNFFETTKIVYFDKNILALNKNAGEFIFGKNSISTKLKQHSKKYSQSLSFTSAPCHRLDTGTSGILLCALSTYGARSIAELQKLQKLQKIYIALLEAPSDNLQLTHTLFRNDITKKTLALSSDYASLDYRNLGKTSLFLQSFEQVSLCPHFSINNVSITLYPTIIILGGSGGKTHQIRSQCAASKRLLWGDIKYTSSRRKFVHINKDSLYTSFFLHASTTLLNNNALSQNSNPYSIPRSFRAPLPQFWYQAIQEPCHNVLHRLENFLDNLALEWKDTKPSLSSTDIIARCTSLFGGVIG